MAELLETFEYAGNVLPVETWARELIKRHTGYEYEQVFHRADDALVLEPGDHVEPQGHVAALLEHAAEGPVVTFTKAGAWMVGHNLAGYLPESDVSAFADWNDARDCLLEEGKRYTEENDEAEWAALVMETDDGPREIGADSEPDMAATWRDSLVETPLEPEKDWGAVIADTSGRQISFWLRWEPSAVPDAVLEGA